MASELLRLESFRITSQPPVGALLRVSEFVVRAGDRIVVMGHSGAGKSLLLSALAGRVPRGLVTAGRRAVTPELARIGFVPQRGVDALHPLMTLGAQLRQVAGVGDGELREPLRAVNLDYSLLGRRPAELSGGQAQRAAIALAWLCRPALVIADEPTSALDPETRDSTLNLFLGLLERRPQTAVVVSTHDPAVAEKLKAHRVEVRAGEVVSSAEVTA